MTLNTNKWYKNPNLLAITTVNDKPLCNIFMTNLLQVCDEYDVKNGTVKVNNIVELLDASYEIFDTVETNLYKSVKQHYNSYVDEIFEQRYWNEQHLPYVKHENSWIDTFDFRNIESASEQLFNNSSKCNK